jgi:hypothetical protein
VPSVAAIPVGQITFPITFETWENYCIENMQFEVADFKMAYNTLLGRPDLITFMAIPHYAYLVLKISDLNGVISIKGDIKQAYDCDHESCEMTDALLASIELQNLKKAMTESPLNLVMPESKTSKLSIQPEDKLSKIV